MVSHTVRLEAVREAGSYYERGECGLARPTGMVLRKSALKRGNLRISTSFLRKSGLECVNLRKNALRRVSKIKDGKNHTQIALKGVVVWR
jgi:hypothetical protein